MNALRGRVNDEALLNQIQSAADAIAESDSPLGGGLIRWLVSKILQDCVVIARNNLARAGIRNWLESQGLSVLLPGELDTVSIGSRRATSSDRPFLFDVARFCPRHGGHHVRHARLVCQSFPSNFGFCLAR